MVLAGWHHMSHDEKGDVLDYIRKHIGFGMHHVLDIRNEIIKIYSNVHAFSLYNLFYQIHSIFSKECYCYYGYILINPYRRNKQIKFYRRDKSLKCDKCNKLYQFMLDLTTIVMKYENNNHWMYNTNYDNLTEHPIENILYTSFYLTDKYDTNEGIHKIMIDYEHVRNVCEANKLCNTISCKTCVLIDYNSYLIGRSLDDKLNKYEELSINKILISQIYFMKFIIMRNVNKVLYYVDQNNVDQDNALYINNMSKLLYINNILDVLDNNKVIKYISNGTITKNNINVLYKFKHICEYTYPDRVNIVDNLIHALFMKYCSYIRNNKKTKCLNSYFDINIWNLEILTVYAKNMPCYLCDNWADTRINHTKFYSKVSNNIMITLILSIKTGQLNIQNSRLPNELLINIFLYLYEYPYYCEYLYFDKFDKFNKQKHKCGINESVLHNILSNELKLFNHDVYDKKINRPNSIAAINDHNNFLVQNNLPTANLCSLCTRNYIMT